MCNARYVNFDVKNDLYKRLSVHIMRFEADSWGINVKEQNKVGVMEIKCLRYYRGIKLVTLICVFFYRYAEV